MASASTVQAAETPTRTEQAVADRPGFLENLPAILAHPLVLLLAGALVSGILVPAFTHQWQAQQATQQTKTEVIDDIAACITPALTEAEVAVNPVFARGDTSRQSIGSTYRIFMGKAANTGADIGAYFPGNDIPRHWSDLYGLVRSFYLFTFAPNRATKSHYLNGIKDYFTFHRLNVGVKWPDLLHDTARSNAYRTSWTQLERAILGVRDRLSQSIMSAPGPSF